MDKNKNECGNIKLYIKGVESYSLNINYSLKKRTLKRVLKIGEKLLEVCNGHKRR